MKKLNQYHRYNIYLIGQLRFFTC